MLNTAPLIQQPQLSHSILSLSLCVCIISVSQASYPRWIKRCVTFVLSCHSLLRPSCCSSAWCITGHKAVYSFISSSHLFFPLLDVESHNYLPSVIVNVVCGTSLACTLDRNGEMILISSSTQNLLFCICSHEPITKRKLYIEVTVYPNIKNTYFSLTCSAIDRLWVWVDQFWRYQL